MILFLIVDSPDQITIRFQMEGPKGELAEGSTVIHPGETVLGIPFETLYKNGSGQFEVDVP